MCTFGGDWGTSRLRCVTIRSFKHNCWTHQAKSTLQCYSLSCRVIATSYQPCYALIWFCLMNTGSMHSVLLTYRYSVRGASMDVKGWRVVVGNAGSGQGGRGSEAHCVAAVRQTWEGEKQPCGRLGTQSTGVYGQCLFWRREQAGTNFSQRGDGWIRYGINVFTKWYSIR